MSVYDTDPRVHVQCGVIDVDGPGGRVTVEQRSEVRAWTVRRGLGCTPSVWDQHFEDRDDAIDAALSLWRRL